MASRFFPIRKTQESPKHTHLHANGIVGSQVLVIRLPFMIVLKLRHMQPQPAHADVSPISKNGSVSVTVQTLQVVPYISTARFTLPQYHIQLLRCIFVWDSAAG